MEEVREKAKKKVKKEKHFKKFKDFKKKDFIEDEKISIITDEQSFKSKNIDGTHLVGFVDVEKIFRVNRERIFIEKKLPFSVLILEFKNSTKKY